MRPPSNSRAARATAAARGTLRSAPCLRESRGRRRSPRANSPRRRTARPQCVVARAAPRAPPAALAPAPGVPPSGQGARRRRVEPLDPGLVAGGARPDRTAERRTLAQGLREALAELPERRRIAVVLFDVEGYSHAEIADVLGIPEGTVRSEVFHARRRLRALLGDWKEDA